MLNKISQKTKELEPFLVEIRRHLHQYPELSGKEVETAKYIYQKLEEAGIHSEIIDTEGGPAVIGNLIVDSSKETICLRADMDALPVLDCKNKSYKSKIHGIMHACGHDFNMSSVLGAAMVLASLKNDLDVNIKFIFQPSEESHPSGAKSLLKKNVMDGIDAIWTIHALPSIQAGRIGIRYGSMTSATDTFKIVVKGKGGHSARPNRTVDAIFVANQIISCLHSSIPMSVDPLNSFVVSIGTIKAGTASNIIAETCEMTGTARAFEDTVRENLHDLIHLRSTTIAQAYGAEIEIEWELGPPPVINDRMLTYLTQATATELLGEDNVQKITKPSMGAEDFSRYLKFAPGMLIRIGTGGEGCCFPLHNSMFDVDEKAISVAVKVLAGVCVNYQLNVCESRDYIKSINSK